MTHITFEPGNYQENLATENDVLGSKKISSISRQLAHLRDSVCESGFSERRRSSQDM